MPESPTSPRATYPDWPHDRSVTDPAHQVVQHFARAVEHYARRSSVSAVARRSELGISTVSNIINGATWPSAVNVAKLENGIGRRLWRARKEDHRAIPIQPDEH